MYVSYNLENCDSTYFATLPLISIDSRPSLDKLLHTNLGLIVENFNRIFNDYTQCTLVIIAISFVFVIGVLWISFTENIVKRKFTELLNKFSKGKKSCSHEKVHVLFKEPFLTCHDCHGPIDDRLNFYEKCIKCGACWHCLPKHCKKP